MGIYGTGYTGTDSPITRGDDREYIYSDIDFLFNPSPLYAMQGLSGDIVRKYDVEAIKQSVKNIVLTNNFERPWKPDFGCNIRHNLFENFEDRWVRYRIKDKIEEQLKKYEPRVTLRNVLLQFDEDYLELNIEVVFTINAVSVRNTTEEITVKIQMERIR
jgi:phage baseplate assembly protein W